MTSRSPEHVVLHRRWRDSCARLREATAARATPAGGRHTGAGARGLQSCAAPRPRATAWKMRGGARARVSGVSSYSRPTLRATREERGRRVAARQRKDLRRRRGRRRRPAPRPARGPGRCVEVSGRTGWGRQDYYALAAPAAVNRSNPPRAPRGHLAAGCGRRRAPIVPAHLVPCGGRWGDFAKLSTRTRHQQRERVGARSIQPEAGISPFPLVT